MAVPGFTAERSLRSSRLSHRLTKARSADMYSRLRPMQSSETGEGVTYDLPGHMDGGGGNGSTTGDGTSDGGVAAGPDGGTPDAGRPDGGTPDAGRPDAGSGGGADAGSGGDAGSYVPPVRVSPPRCFVERSDGSWVEVPCNNPNEI
jgi:hypothetical protein